jgi:hypothetical protein
MEEISWNDRVENGEVLHRFKEERYLLRTIKIRMANWISHILLRNCLLKHGFKGKIGREDDEEDVSSDWMILRKSEDTVN